MWPTNESIINSLGMESNWVNYNDIVNEPTGKNRTDEKISRVLTPRFKTPTKRNITTLPPERITPPKDSFSEGKKKKRKAELLEQDQQNNRPQTDFMKKQVGAKKGVQSKKGELTIIPETQFINESREKSASINELELFLKIRSLYESKKYDEVVQMITSVIGSVTDPISKIQLLTLQGDIYKRNSEFKSASDSYGLAIKTVLRLKILNMAEYEVSLNTISAIFSFEKKLQDLNQIKSLENTKLYDIVDVANVYQDVSLLGSQSNERETHRKLAYLHLDAAEYFLDNKHIARAKESYSLAEQEVSQLDHTVLTSDFYNRLELMKLRFIDDPKSVTPKQHFFLAVDYLRRHMDDQAGLELAEGISKISEHEEPLTVSRLYMYHAIGLDRKGDYGQAAASYDSLLAYLQTRNDFFLKPAVEQQTIWRWLLTSTRVQEKAMKDSTYTPPYNSYDIIKIYRASLSDGKDAAWNPEHLLRAQIYAGNLLIFLNRVEEADEVVNKLNALHDTMPPSKNSKEAVDAINEWLAMLKEKSVNVAPTLDVPCTTEVESSTCFEETAPNPQEYDPFHSLDEYISDNFLGLYNQ